MKTKQHPLSRDIDKYEMKIRIAVMNDIKAILKPGSLVNHRIEERIAWLEDFRDAT